MSAITYYSARAHLVLAFAHEEAKAFKHQCVTTGHILIGLIRTLDDEGRKSIGLDEASIRAAVERISPPSDRAFLIGELPYSSCACTLLQISIDENMLQQPYVSTGFMMIAMLKDSDFIGYKALKLVNADFEKIRQECSPVDYETFMKKTGLS